MIHIANDVFGAQADEFGYGSSNETIVVSGGFSSEAGVAALARVANRLLLVDETGFEHATWEAMVDAGDEFYTPNYVSDPEIRQAGIELYVDCKGEIPEPMRERFLHILREELADLDDVSVASAVSSAD